MKSVLLLVLCMLFVIASGCGTSEQKVKELARIEAQKAIDDYKKSFAPVKYEFGIPWEKEWSYAQGVRTGNLIFISGQLAHTRDVKANGQPKMLFGSFEEQYKYALENVKAVVEHFGGTMDDIVYLQNFVDKDAEGLKAGDIWKSPIPILQKYFPKGLQSMIWTAVDDLYGEGELVEVMAIAVVH
ncbi:MAG: RidA family protein [Candidatus Latescibacter sp.]|nr:RidA family protein [Candidatus Latescibacter sp.]